MTTILHIDTSARQAGSHTRDLSAELVKTLRAKHGDGDTVYRDAAKGIEFIDPSWVEANFTPADARTDDQKTRLSASDELVAELMNADHIVIGAPLYNFSVPAVLKAWVDQVCRAGVTFRYEPTGPVGLLEGKKAYLVVASGGTELAGPVDFATGYMRQVLSFIGITDIDIISASQTMMDETKALQTARSAIAAAA
ncbi:MAG: NAD(P)H-dependent oxidoreductase [Pseudomonadota bacterium]